MEHKKTILIILALVIVAGGAFLYILRMQDNVSEVDNQMNQQIGEIQPMNNLEMKTLPNGLQIGDAVLGTGDEAVSGKMVAVHYTGTLIDGTKFDSSLDRGEPFVFALGAGQVIKGWDEGVAGMKVGGKRHLIIPADLAYGDRAVGNVIPAGATLVFDIELLGVK